MGFLPTAALVTKKRGFRLPQCQACGLYKGCLAPKMPVAGEGARKVLIVGEAPGETEDARGKPFIGKAGQYLQKILRELGVDLFTDCWVTNSLRCRPPSNRTPHDKEVLYCRPYLLEALETLQPRVVILLGAAAVRSLIGHLWKEDVGGVSRWVGYQIPARAPNAWVCPAFHPSHCLRAEEEKNVLPRFFLKKHLAAAFTLTKRPWQTIPEERKQVRLIYDSYEACLAIDGIGEHAYKSGIPVAVDYETDRLKPDENSSRIVCCSLSDGETTIAYPWYGEVVSATCCLLQARSVGKIASNLKFEERWTRKHLGIRVRNWAFDTMLAAHVLDNREGTTSIKFQSFIRLGMPSYNDGVEPYLHGEGGNGSNRIKEVPLDQILLYNGLDSLLEWQVAQQQAQELGVTW